MGAIAKRNRKVRPPFLIRLKQPGFITLAEWAMLAERQGGQRKARKGRLTSKSITGYVPLPL